MCGAVTVPRHAYWAVGVAQRLMFGAATVPRHAYWAVGAAQRLMCDAAVMRRGSYRAAARRWDQRRMCGAPAVRSGACWAAAHHRAMAAAHLLVTAAVHHWPAGQAVRRARQAAVRAPRVGPAQQAAGLAAHSLADRVPPVARHARFAAVHV